jgi:hypothetical protein
MAHCYYHHHHYHYNGPHGIVYIIPQGQQVKCAPLQDVAVKVNIIGHVASVALAQRYKNDYPAAISGTYIFPVPARAAICGFSFVRGDGKKVLGAVKEKDEAKAEYDAAKAAGKTAALGEEQTKDGKRYPHLCEEMLIKLFSL